MLVIMEAGMPIELPECGKADEHRKETEGKEGKKKRREREGAREKRRKKERKEEVIQYRSHQNPSKTRCLQLHCPQPHLGM